MSEETVTFNLEINVEQAFSTVRKLELIAYRTINLLRRMGLPENVDDAIAKVQRFIMTVRLAHSAILAFEAASGPIGWIMAGLGIAATVLTAGDIARELQTGA